MNYFNSIKESLPFKEVAAVSHAMDSDRFKVNAVHPRAVTVGWLADDLNSSNPLLDQDGHGQIHTSHRHASRESHAAMQEALGLDAYWGDDLSLVEDHPQLRKRWIAEASHSSEFRTYCQETAGRNAVFSDDYYRRRAERFWQECSKHDRYGIDEFEFTDKAKHGLFCDLLAERSLGEPDRVLLDCYEHGMQVWSIRGSGTQCRWDTSVGSGVWVPDSVARAEIDRREKVYAFGSVTSSYEQGRKVWRAQIDPGFLADAELRAGDATDTWYESFQWLEQAIQRHKLKLFGTKKQQAFHTKQFGRARARNELASEALELYNSWLAGNVYGIAVATFQLHELGCWEIADVETVWGYFGTDDAYQALDALFEEVRADFDAIIDPVVWQQTGPIFGYGAGI